MADEAGRPTNEAELTRHLADTLVENEVMKPMDSIEWTFGTPPRPGQPDNPVPGAAPTAAVTPAPAATTAAAEGASAQANVPAVTIDWEALKDPTTGLYAGKYQTPQEAAKGIGHAVNMAKDALAQKAALAQEVATLRAERAASPIQPTASPAVASPSAIASAASRADADAAQARLDKVLSDIAENGGVLDEDAVKSLQRTLREANVVSARAAAEDALVARDAGRAQDDANWKAVDTFMEKTYPESAKFADEIGLFVQTNPLISKAVNALVASGDRVAATEFAWVEYSKARGSVEVAATQAAAEVKEIQLGAADQVRQEAVAAARKDAGIVATSAGGVHEVRNAAPSQSEIASAAAGMRAYGMQPGNPAAARWRELVIPLDPKVFDI